LPSIDYNGMERRDLARRAELVRWVVTEIVQNPGIQITTAALAEWLHVSIDAAQRIVDHLADAGLVREIRRGVWTHRTG
jgi:Mn-dependent DtxR family transcriptional regulator